MATPKLLKSLRQDPQKIEEGIWIEHPESKDRFRVRPVMCSQHAKAYLAALQDKMDELGEDAVLNAEQEREVDAVATSVGLVLDWQLADYPDMEYDAPTMASLLTDPELEDFQVWFRMMVQKKDEFRPEEAGND